MIQKIMNIVTIVVFTVIVVFAYGSSYGDDVLPYGKVNVEAINTGNLQLKGVTWCKKYFDKCVLKETWAGKTLSNRVIVTPVQFVIMQTSVTNPQIIDFDDVGGGRYRIMFVLDQSNKHERWIPQYKEK